MAQNRMITGRFNPNETPQTPMREDDSQGLLNLLVAQALLGHCYRGGSADAPEFWVRVEVDGRAQHSSR